MSFLIHEVATAAASRHKTGAALRFTPPSIESNVYTESEIDIKQIELEICAAACARAFDHIVGQLLLMTQTHAEHAKRHIETYIVHYEHAQPRAEIESHRGYICTCIAQLASIIALETRRPAAETQVYVVEHTEALHCGQSHISAVEHTYGV